MNTNDGSFCVKTIPVIQSDLRGVLLLVVSYSDKVAGGGEGRPGDVEPAGAGQQLVGIRTDRGRAQNSDGSLKTITTNMDEQQKKDMAEPAADGRTFCHLEANHQSSYH